MNFFKKADESQTDHLKSQDFSEYLRLLLGERKCGKYSWMRSANRNRNKIGFSLPVNENSLAGQVAGEKWRANEDEDEQPGKTCAASVP